MRVPHRKTYKNDRYDVIKQKFEKMKKVSSQIFVKIICVHFHQNRTKIVETIHPDRQTHTQTHKHTHTKQVQRHVPSWPKKSSAMFRNISHNALIRL